MGSTIYDIARKAGVSIATVSRVLNESDRVSADTRLAVLNAAESLGYHPHTSARNLARRKSDVVSAVIPMMTNLFFAEVLRGLQDRLVESDYQLIVHSARTLDEVDSQLERALNRGQSDGVLLFSSPIENGRARQLAQSGLPVVLVDSFHPDLDSVTTDNRLGGEMATQHLIDLGCKRIALVMANPKSRPSVDRRDGFLRIMKTAGLELPPDFIVSSEDPLHHGYSEISGRQAMESLFKRGKVPDGVFATSDVQALGVIRAIQDAGLRVPDDIRVIGFDDIVVSRYVGLSTLRQPRYEIGSTAIDKLMARIDQSSRPVSHTLFVPHLIERHTTTRSGAAAILGSLNEFLPGVTTAEVQADVSGNGPGKAR